MTASIKAIVHNAAQEDRATAVGNMHKNFVKIYDTLSDIQTQKRRQTTPTGAE